jgi:hypothetical protein
MINSGVEATLSPAFMSAIRRFGRASRVRLEKTQKSNAVTATLYHYTDREALKGIVEKQQFWFTHYQHLNDDTELEFGMNAAKAVLAEIGARIPKAKLFCEMVDDLFSNENMRSTFGFYIASFSRNRDDPHQWKNYAQGGEGFAIGLGPQLFGVDEKPNRKPHENIFVSPVHYGAAAARIQHLPAIESAARISAETVERRVKAMNGINRWCIPFFREMANSLIAGELILNSLIVKNSGWAPEHEVRLVIFGEVEKLKPSVLARPRGTKTVPYIKSDMPIQQPGNIVEIVIGSRAPDDAEDFACELLAPFHSNPSSIIRRSTHDLTMHQTYPD